MSFRTCYILEVRYCFYRVWILSETTVGSKTQNTVQTMKTWKPTWTRRRRRFSKFAPTSETSLSSANTQSCHVIRARSERTKTDGIHRVLSLLETQSTITLLCACSKSCVKCSERSDQSIPTLLFVPERYCEYYTLRKKPFNYVIREYVFSVFVRYINTFPGKKNYVFCGQTYSVYARVRGTRFKKK